MVRDEDQQIHYNVTYKSGIHVMSLAVELGRVQEHLRASRDRVQAGLDCLESDIVSNGLWYPAAQPGLTDERITEEENTRTSCA
jgi:hypothetical protein